MKITKTSIISGKVSTRDISVTEQELLQVQRGRHIQWVCPHLSPEDREFLISGITPQEWEETLGSEED